jgi:hypothetical protein
MTKRRRILLWLGLVVSLLAAGYAGTRSFFMLGLVLQRRSVGRQNVQPFGHTVPWLWLFFSLASSFTAWCH